MLQPLTLFKHRMDMTEWDIRFLAGKIDEQEKRITKLEGWRDMKNDELIRLDSLCKPLRYKDPSCNRIEVFCNTCKWYSIESGEKPADDETCLVSWWDNRQYRLPIRAYWDENKFMGIDPLYAFPLKVDIWCRIPETPKEKL